MRPFRSREAAFSSSGYNNKNGIADNARICYNNVENLDERVDKKWACAAHLEQSRAEQSRAEQSSSITLSIFMLSKNKYRNIRRISSAIQS